MDPMQRMEGRAPNWVRLGMAVLGVPQLVTGIWAVVTPRDWYQSFPGLDPRLVAAEPPFNTHLATDAGAGFLATGVALGLGALFATRGAVFVALFGYLAFAIPHAVYHSSNPAPGLSSTEDTFNALLLWSSVVIALVFVWGARPRTGTPVPRVARS
jgi:hypothetical protein